jgi:hypothetical protein
VYGMDLRHFKEFVIIIKEYGGNGKNCFIDESVKEKIYKK